MAGRLGGERTTVQNLFVARIDTELNLVFVKGAVPGVDDAQILVRDAKKRVVSSAAHKFAKSSLVGGTDEAEGDGRWLPLGVDALPFPAGVKEMEEALPKVVVATPRGRNPFVPLA